MSVSELKVSWNATILNCCTSTESRWNKNDDSLGSPETETNRSPSSHKKRRPSVLIGPMVSKATGMKIIIILNIHFYLFIIICFIYRPRSGWQRESDA